MIKKLVTMVGISSLLKSFAFYKIENIYIDPNQIPTKTRVFKLSEWEKNNLRLNAKAFLYDPHTFNKMEHYIFITNKDREYLKTKEDFSKFLDQQLSFLKCNFKYDNSFWESENLKKMNEMVDCNFPYTYEKQELLFNQDKTINKIFTAQANTNTSTIPFVFNRQLKSKSDVTIDHKAGEVFLSKGDKKVTLTTALRKFFDSSVYEDFADGLAQSNKEYGEKQQSERLIMPFFDRLKKTSLFPEVDLKLLKNSKILAVWRLISDANVNIESQMLGLAEDKEGKLFHWGTNLREDIDGLIKYASKSLDPDSNILDDRKTD